MIMIQYGLYLPHTPRRCAVFMAVQIVAANLATVAAGQASPAVAHMRTVLLNENAQGLLGGAALCIYSTVKARALERELRAARREARSLGQYRLKGLLGSGGMGEVYLAEHRLLKRPCAVKMIHPDRAGNAEALRRFEREVQATARLRHPNTVEVFDYGCAEDGTFYYVMEYLSGLSLDRLVQRHGPLPAARAVHLVRQLCGALREAHAAGLIHRDIKPGNVLVCRDSPPDRAKLLDFGLVRTTGPTASLTQDHLLGTPGYMAPEQIEGTEAVGAAADLYSLGAVLFFLLTGHGPFERDTPMRTLIAQLRESPNRLGDDVSPALEAVVLRCLTREATGRYANAAELDRALSRCVSGDWTEDAAAAWWAGCERDNAEGKQAAAPHL
jgi:serine/threonine-protein kinase